MSRCGNDISTLRPGEIRVIDGRLWGRCKDCRRIVRLDGWLGDLHLCI